MLISIIFGKLKLNVKLKVFFCSWNGSERNNGTGEEGNKQKITARMFLAVQFFRVFNDTRRAVDHHVY